MENLSALYNICHVDNLKSILKEGILSYQQVKEKAVDYVDMHANKALARPNKKLPGGNHLQSYVPLYFQPRNAMLYRLTCNDNKEKLAILQIKSSILKAPGTMLANRNTTAVDVAFMSAKDLSQIDDSIFAQQYWNDSDDSKQRMMATALVSGTIPPNSITAVYTAKINLVAKNLIKNHGIKYVVDPPLFFYPQFSQSIADNILLAKGDLFFSDYQTFTVTVNLKGVMGKGLALRAKYQFPDAYVHYQDDCKYKRLKIGRPTLFKRGIRIEETLADNTNLLKPKKLNGTRWFLFLPTKRDWRHRARLGDVKASMQWLLAHYKSQAIQSIALPALGCGLGNLQWKDVGPMMCYYLKQMDITSCIYLPKEQEEDKQWLKPEYLLSYQPEQVGKISSTPSLF